MFIVSGYTLYVPKRTLDIFDLYMRLYVTLKIISSYIAKSIVITAIIVVFPSSLNI